VVIIVIIIIIIIIMQLGIGCFWFIYRQADLPQIKIREDESSFSRNGVSMKLPAV